VSTAPLLDDAPATGPACAVERLRLFRFRNYLDESIELGPGLNVLCGENAQGKTNLLEAVATLALSRSPRAATVGELVTWGAPVARVEARIRRLPGPMDLDMRITRQGGVGGADRSQRTTLVDGKERPARALLGLCPVVLFWPDDLQLVKGSPEGRRRLLDVVLSQLDPVAADDLIRYRRSLDQRNALLRQIRQGTATSAALPQFTDALVRYGGAVRAHRSRLAVRLSPLAAAALRELSGGDEELRLAYSTSTDTGAADDGLGSVVDATAPVIAPEALDPSAAAEELAATLRRRAAEELARGLTVAGPHRDDLTILLAGRPARSTASQGQQRSAVLACKLAEVRHVAGVAGVAPVLLLDDVLSELDAGRRERLMAGLGTGRGSQALLTTAEATPPELAALGELRQFRVHSGRIDPV
jgi:DNA replication and repair protein RecF